MPFQLWRKSRFPQKKSFITSTTWVNIVPYFILLKCTIQGVDEAWPTYFYKCVCPAGQTHPMLRNLSCSLNKLHLDKCQLANRLRIVASIYFTSAMNITQLLTWIENVNLLHHSVHFYSSSELSDRCSLLKWNK